MRKARNRDVPPGRRCPDYRPGRDVPTSFRRDPSRAFTAIEILIVIVIISILVGILVPVVIAVQRKARKHTAVARLKGMRVAIDRYYHELGCYPRDTGTFDLDLNNYDKCQDTPGTNATAVDDPYSLYRFLCGPNGQGIQRPGGGNRTFGPYITFDDNELDDESTEGEPWKKIALDPWGRPWVFEEHMSWSLQEDLDRTTVAGRADGRYGHKQNNYDIYSIGPDGSIDATRHNLDDDDGDGLVDEPDEAQYESRYGPGDEGDDIVNW